MKRIICNKFNLLKNKIKKVSKTPKQLPKKVWRIFAQKFPKAAKFLGKRSNQKNLAFIIKIAAILIAGWLSVFYVFWRQFGWDGAFTFIVEHPEIYGYSVLIMSIVAILFFGIVGSTAWSIGIFYSVISIIMFINDEKIRSRNVPFLPEDLTMSSEAGTLKDLVNWGNLMLTVLLIIAILVVSFWLNKNIKKIPHYNFSKKYRLLAQIIIVGASGTLLAFNTAFLRTQLYGKGTFIKVDWLNSNIDFTDTKYNYDSNGYIVSTISAFQNSAPQKPDGYSKDAIKKIIDKYSKVASAENANREKLSTDSPNIIFIMSESFVDPAKIKNFYDYGKHDPIPYTREILKKYTSGRTATAEYGGGTANVEFEAVTGLSNYFLNSVPYTTLLPSNPQAPSLAKSLAKNGYSTTAIHPYNGTMYKRNVVYPNLGFKKFIDISKFKNTSKIDNSKYISDEVAFDQVLAELKATKNKDFVHLVTMQNHMPYDSGTYSSNDFPVKNIAGSDSEAKSWETYIQGINKSDTALKEFIKKLQTLNEKTIVVFWGDHWPGIASALLNSNQKADAQSTPLFIYSNFNTEKKELNQISLNYLQVKIFDQIGAKLSPFQQLLLENSKKNPALTKKISPQDTQELKDYEMIEYDILSGKKYSTGSFYEQ